MDKLTLEGCIMRIGKLMSNAGICSRKEANKLIEEGRIYVNGELCFPGKWVEWDDEILFDGKAVEKQDDVYIIMNKPPGIVCTMDVNQKNNIIDHLGYHAYIFPVGRLDKESEGLMFMTNDGELANQVLRAEHEHEKEYIVTVDKSYDDAFLETLSKGVEIFGVQTRPCDVVRVDEVTFNITLSQGINRQIRKMCKKFGYNVTKLKRIRIVNLSLEGLGLSDWRHIRQEELECLKKTVRFENI